MINPENADEYVIRQANAADAETLARLASETMREAFGPPHNPMAWVDAYIQTALTPAMLAQELTEKRSAFFVLETKSGQAAGYAKVRRKVPPRRLPERKTLEIQRFYLLPMAQGRGVGRRLMDYCLAYARESGFRAVYLGVWERNQKAIRFYERLGFKPFSWHWFQFGPDRQRDVWMEKEL